MSEVVIKVENISKKYTILHNQKNENNLLLGSFVNSIKNIFQHKKKTNTHEEFWALKNINFEINKGDRVGIIGRNGAGKSTLLKILSRITHPTKGRIEITGRVASLLEVGTGFHGDLSGRENIYLNGSILGMSKQEIDSKFDEIVAFSEIEQFLDTPVKRYSSGMYVKLAFSVAAHLNPDILILDEVLAVGDAAFQKKCIDKINEMSSSGNRTILFVSHNISSIRSVCNKAIYFESGKLIDFDTLDKIIPQYQNFTKTNISNNINVDIIPLSSSGNWEVDTDVNIQITWEKGRFKEGWHCDLACYTAEGVKVFALQSHLFSEFETSSSNNGITFTVRNIGYAFVDLRLDLGIKKNIDSSYSILVENCGTLSPSQKLLPLYKREDVITVPTSICKAIS